MLSPITGHVLGSSEVKVVKNKETITDLKVRVVSGISLVVQPDAGLQNQFILQTILSEKLSTKYQVSNGVACHGLINDLFFPKLSGSLLFNVQ